MGEGITIEGPYYDFEKVVPHVQNRDFELATVDIQLHSDLFAGVHIAEVIQQFLRVSIVFLSGIVDKKIIEKTDKIRGSIFL